ncbi:MAG: hypothetical protein LWW86_10595 [Micrococcales bacterium]|nr:hypothetical protein [Micrococcales bacterium]
MTTASTTPVPVTTTSTSSTSPAAVVTTTPPAAPQTPGLVQTDGGGLDGTTPLLPVGLALGALGADVALHAQRRYIRGH